MKTKPKKYEVESIWAHYENFLIKIKGKKDPVFASHDFVKNIFNGIKIKGVISKKRTRTWIE